MRWSILMAGGIILGITCAFFSTHSDGIWEGVWSGLSTWLLCGAFYCWGRNDSLG